MVWKVKPQAEVLAFGACMFETFQQLSNFSLHVFYVKSTANDSKLQNHCH